MGWRDRDWAKLTDAEWQAIYGFRRTPPSCDEGVRASLAGRRRDWTRVATWGGVAVATVVVLAFGFATRVSGYPHSIANDVGGAASTLYGIAGANDLVCTEMALHQTSRQWRCLMWAMNPNSAVVVEPRGYRGTCGHVIADQTIGAWTCVSAVPPPEATLPPA